MIMASSNVSPGLGPQPRGWDPGQLPSDVALPGTSPAHPEARSHPTLVYIGQPRHWPLITLSALARPHLTLAITLPTIFRFGHRSFGGP